MSMSVKFNVVMLCAAILFALICVLVSCKWYANRQGIPFKEALGVLWQKCFIKGFQELRQSFIPTTKMVGAVAWSYAKRWAAVLGEFFKTAPAPVKHIFTPELKAGIYEAIREYIYTPFQPIIKPVCTSIPYALYVDFYMKHAITAETAAEITWHILSKFQDYLTYHGLLFEYFAIPYVEKNHIEVWLYYCENLEEYPAYRERCRQVMLMKADPEFRPLPESAIPQTPGLVLGYRYENWKAMGQVVPIVWDVATAPHLMVSGPTGGGKTIFVKALLEKLLRTGAHVTVCDFKGHHDMKGFVKDFAAGNDCDRTLSKFCADFEKARTQDTADDRRRVLIFDEFGAFVASKEKKEVEALMKMLSGVIFMGRSYGYSVILVAQRFDAEVIKTSFREQFGVKVYMGTSISQQAATMLFPESEIDKSSRLAPYCGYISTPKTDKDVLILPQIDIKALDKRLRKLGDI